MRTNIEIDDELMLKAMAASGAETKKAAVEEGLQMLVTMRNQADALRELWGSGVWRGPDDDWSSSDEEIVAKRDRESRSVARGKAKRTDRAGEPEPVGARGVR
jgi:Arc/MetJ family transcription regulator